MLALCTDEAKCFDVGRVTFEYIGDRVGHDKWCVVVQQAVESGQLGKGKPGKSTHEWITGVSFGRYLDSSIWYETACSNMVTSLPGGT